MQKHNERLDERFIRGTTDALLLKDFTRKIDAPELGLNVTRMPNGEAR